MCLIFFIFLHYLLKLHYFIFAKKKHHSERKVLNNEARMEEKQQLDIAECQEMPEKTPPGTMSCYM